MCKRNLIAIGVHIATLCCIRVMDMDTLLYVEWMLLLVLFYNCSLQFHAPDSRCARMLAASVDVCSVSFTVVVLGEYSLNTHKDTAHS